MGRKKKQVATTEQLAFYVPQAEATAIREVAALRGLSLSQWLREAAQWNLIREGRRAAPAEEEAYIREVFRDIFAGVNFAAITAHAVLLLLQQREVRELTAAEGLPESLARERVALAVEAVIRQATEIFTHPALQQDYSWVRHDPDTISGLFRYDTFDDGED